MKDRNQLDVVDVTARIRRALKGKQYGLLVRQLQEIDSTLAQIPAPILGQLCAWTPGVQRVNGSRPARWRLKKS